MILWSHLMPPRCERSHEKSGIMQENSCQHMSMRLKCHEKALSGLPKR